MYFLKKQLVLGILLVLAFYYLLTSLFIRENNQISKRNTISAYEVQKSFDIIKLLLHQMLNFVKKNAYMSTNSSHRILCLILTRKENLQTKALVVNRTWAKNCDKHFFVAQMFNDGPYNESYELYKPLPILQPSGHNKEVYERLTDKVFKTLRDVYLNYPQYEWYLKADDDTFVFVDQLRIFLASESPREPVTFGYEFNVLVERGYLSGGAGYVLSGEALSRLGNRLVANFDSIRNTGVEDVDVAVALHSLGVHHKSSMDSQGRERFHTLDLSSLVRGDLGGWTVYASEHVPKGGIECCSSNTISFHYMTPDKIENLYTVWTHLKNESSNKISNKTLNVDSLLYSLIL